MLTSWSNYIIAISHSKMGTNKHSRINLTNAFLCSIYCAKCFQTWKGAGSYHWSRNTSCVKKKKKAEVVFFRAEKMNLFYPLLSWLYTKQQNCAQICYVFGFHYSSLQTHPQLTANIVPHPWCSSKVWLPPGAKASDLLSSCILSHLGALR